MSPISDQRLERATVTVIKILNNSIFECSQEG